MPGRGAASCWRQPPQPRHEAQAPACLARGVRGSTAQSGVLWTPALSSALRCRIRVTLYKSLDCSMGRFPAKQYLLTCTTVKSVAKSSCTQNTGQNFVTCCGITEQGLKLACSRSHLGTDDMGKSKMENCVSAGFPL